jgi:hypothetical protein
MEGHFQMIFLLCTFYILLWEYGVCCIRGLKYGVLTVHIHLLILLMVKYLRSEVAYD